MGADVRLVKAGFGIGFKESWEQALAVAREAGLEDAIRPLVEIRLADLPPRE